MEKGVFSEGAELRHTASAALTLELMDGLPEDDTEGCLCILGDQWCPHPTNTHRGTGTNHEGRKFGFDTLKTCSPRASSTE